jgi:hypothetical protein
VTVAQRLRLVVALGVVNLVLAGVALGFGIVGLPASNRIAAGPTPPTAIALPTPTLPTTRPGPSPRPTPTPPASHPPASTPPTQPTPTPTPTPPTQPTPTPTPAPPTAAPETAGSGDGGIVLVVAHPTGGTPQANPVPIAPAGPPACDAVSGYRPPADHPKAAEGVGLVRLAEACPPPGMVKPPKAVKPPRPLDRPPKAHGPKPGHGHHGPLDHKAHPAKHSGGHHAARGGSPPKHQAKG